MTPPPPKGIASLHDHRRSREVEELWQRIEDGTGLSGVRVTPFPHHSYPDAGRLDTGALDARLHALAGRSRPLTVRVRAVATFGGSWPVV